jgi:thiamine biosynthesis lipoprotein
MTPPSNSVRRARPLLGTIVEIQASGLGESESHAAIDAAFAEIEEVQRRMSFHDPASTLSRLNRLAGVEPLPVDDWTFDVLEFAAEMHRVARGIFDVTVAPHLQTQGFLPADERGAARAVGFAAVQLLPDRCVRFHHPDLRLDLGGIAKGYAVDRAVAALQRAGIQRGLVNAGGDLRAFGDEAFAISIRHPDNPLAALATIPLHESSLATSAHYFADRLVPGATLGPIVHPPSGEPTAIIRSATVRACTAMAADALTKVVMLAGEDALPVLAHFEADAIFVAESGAAMCSPGFHAAFELSS